HHARRPHLPGPRRAVLLRGEHARRGAAHVHLRADQRHAAVRGRDGQPRLARRTPRGQGPRSGPEHPRRPADLRAGGRGPRAVLHPDQRGPQLKPPPGQPLADALRGYLQHLTVERGLAASTVESYRRDLRRYASVLAGQGKTALDEITPGDVAGCLAGRDPAREVPPPSPPRRLPKAITLAEVERLLDAAGPGPDDMSADPRRLRDRALLEFLYGTGARISEATGLDVDELELGPVPGSPQDPLVRLIGKGGKHRVVPVGSYAARALDRK